MKVSTYFLLFAFLLPVIGRGEFTFSKIADTSMVVPGQGSGLFSSIGNPRIRDGLVVFRGADAQGNEGIYRFESNSLSEVVFAGDAAPSLPGYRFSTFGANPNPEGTSVTFGAVVTNGANQVTTLVTAHAGAGGLTNRGDSLVTLSPSSGEIFENLGGSGNAAVSGGAIVFRGEESTTPSAGIYTDALGGLSTVIDFSTPVPGLPTYHFTAFNSEPTFKGTIGINASISDGITTEEINVIATPNGVLTPVVDTVQSTSLATGGRIGSITRFAVDGLHYAVTAADTNGVRELLTNVGGGVTSVANLSTPVPGHPTLTFDSIDSDDQSIDGQRIVFNASFDSFSKRGIYLWEHDTLHRVIDSTMLLEGKTPTTLTVDLGSAISANQIVFKARFSDGSEGAFMTFIHEPGMPAAEYEAGGFANGYGIGANQYRAAQTFRAQLSGQAGEATVHLASGGPTTPFITFSLTEVADGVPGAVLGSVDLISPTLSSELTPFSVDFSSLGIFLTEGTDYALTISTPGSALIVGNNEDPYLEGAAFVSQDFGATWNPFRGGDPTETPVDFYFRVNVNRYRIADLGGDWVDANTLPTGWSYFDADAPSGGTEVALSAGQIVGNAGHAGFGGGANGFQLGAVTGEGEIFVDGNTNGLVAGVDLAVHTGDDSNLGNDGYDYLILRYTLSASDIAKGSLAYVSGSFRELVDNGGDSVSVALYVNSGEQWSATSADGSILTQADGSFMLPGLPVTAGDTVDFVIDNNGNLSADETAVRAAIHIGKSPYETWAVGQGLVLGVNAATTDDPNGDGRVNFQHFATSSDPLGSQGNEGKFRVLIHQLPAAGTPRVMTYTFPVRSFDSNTSPPRTNYGIYADQVNYYLEADQSLPVSRFLVIDELVPALDAGLPLLHPAWEYRTFFITNSIETLPLGFMQLRVEED